MGVVALLALPSFLATLLLWIPFRLGLIGNIEEWGLLGVYTARHPIYWADAHSLIPSIALRPLSVFPQSLAFRLHPDSFVLWHAFQFTAITVKGSTVAYLFWRATNRRAWAALAGVLAILYPADTMQLSFRSLHINFAIAVSLLGVSLFVAGTGSPARWRRLTLAVTGGLLFFVACLTYEATLVFAVLPLFVVMTRDGWLGPVRVIRRRRVETGIWVAAVLAYPAFYMLAPRPASGVYQSGLSNGATLRELIHNMASDMVQVALPRSILGGWRDAVYIVATQFTTYWYIGLGTTLLCGVIAFIAHRAGNDKRSAAAPGAALRPVLLGIVCAAAGSLPFLTSLSHVGITQRTYLVAGVGGAIAWAAIVTLLGRRAVLPWLVAIPLVLFGFGAQLFQFHVYQQMSDTERTLLTQAMEAIDVENPAATPIVVRDASNQIGQTWMFVAGDFWSPLTYLYNRPFGTIEVCRQNGDWARPDPTGRLGHCKIEGDAFVFRQTSSGAVGARIPLKDAEVVTIGDEPVELPGQGRRAELMSDPSVVGRRYRAIARNAIGHGDWMFKDARPRASYQLDFGRWGFDTPIRGSGWMEPQRLPSALGDRTTAWKAAPVSTVDFPLAPVATDYRVRGRFDAFASAQLRDQTRLSLNGQPITVTWSPDGAHFEANVPKGLARSGDNTIAFTTPATDLNAGFSASIDWFRIEPR